MLRPLLALFLTLAIALPAAAQQAAWVQIEAQRSLTEAQDSARDYMAAGVEDVAGFSLPSGWYGIVLGPYTEADAERVLRELRRTGRIPSDSYLVDGRQFRTQYWPAGAAIPRSPVTPTETAPQTNTTAEPIPAPAPPVQPVIATPDETRAEAQASERLLSRAEKQDLQTAMQWAGFYSGAIDGLYGRGTRGAMTAWQEANNHEPTGVLTTAQRAELITAYNAILDGMDLQLVRDDATGIEMQIPMGVVDFAAYSPPFARFEPSGDLDAQVLLISQPGDQNRLYGLYEILQTLAVVPTDGPRNRRSNSFEIEGMNSEIHSYTSVRLTNGQIKGYMLIWPAGDDDRRRRVLQEMQDSFTTIDGVLDPGIAPPDENQAIDLISGLEIRQPDRDRSGTYITARGDVLTTIEAVDGCRSVTLGLTHEATVLHRDEALGLAVLRPSDTLSAPAVAEFQTGVPRLHSDIAVAGFPYGNVLTTPALTFGTLEDIRGLNGEEEVKRLSITAQPGDAGGPVFDNGGAVLGMLLPRQMRNGQQLPPDVHFSVDAEQIVSSLDGAGLALRTTSSLAYMTPETLTGLAGDVTVLVSCWNS